MRRKLATLATVGAAAVLLSGIKLAAQVQVYPDVLNEIKHDTSPPLSQMNPQAEHGPKHTHKWLKGPIGGRPGQTDPVVQSSAGPLVGTTNGLNFLGVGVGLGNFLPNAAPPDTNGAAGATQFVQWVNESFAVFNKSTGALVYGPVAGNTLWSGFGGPCESSNDGDIIAQYDKAANRWVMAQPVFSSPYYYCIAVSTTSDATGSYNRYQFPTPSNSNEFPDYPKLGVWPDAYYASFNLFLNGNSFSGAAACAFDRTSMLGGLTANPAQCFTNTGEASFLPSDLDGSTPPPSGSPAYFVDLGSFSSLNLYKFHVDFTTPASSTFTGPTSIPVAAFTEACGGGTCIPESGGSKLDSLGDRLMYRLAYRNLGDHEALVVSHSVDPSGTGSGVTGVRWYEIRSPGSSPTVFQQGTYQPDSSYRWMPSIAMDKAGDIAVGYSASSSSIHPAIRYTGRVPGDPSGTFEAENSIVEGGGSQDGGLTRWGDYSSMAIDPSDDCTFWYTNEYELNSGSFNWSTRIASFKFPSCGGPPTPDFTISAAPSSQTVVQGNSTSYTVNIGALNGFTGTVSFGASGLGAGATASFNPTTVNGSGSTTMTVNTTSGAATGTFTVTITGTSGVLTHTATVTLVVNPPPDFSISATPGSRTVNQGNSTTYTATVTALNGFSGTASFSASGLPSGATAGFNPGSVVGSGSSTLTVTTASSTPTGTYTLTITGTSGALVHSTTVTLIVLGPADFSISATPSARTVTQGTGTTYSVTIGAVNGFGGTVSFGTGGFGSGATASFSPTTVTGSGSTTMTVTTASGAATGTFTVTITGTSGALSHSTTVTFVVNPAPDFSLSASPASQTVRHGSSTTYSVTVGALNGFTGTVSFSVSNLPSHSNGSFSPSTVTGSGATTLTVSTNRKTPTGTRTLTITGTSGALTRSTTVSLTVD